MNFFEYDVVKRREELRKENEKKALHLLKTSKTIDKKSNKVLNYVQYERCKADICNDEGINPEKFLETINSDKVRLRLFAKLIAKNASRQGETIAREILSGINSITAPKGFSIEILANTALRPLKSGGFQFDGKKTKNTLKTIDAFVKIDKTLGYIFAKVVVDDGGHQDNVITEAEDFIKWSSNEPTDKLYIVLIDGSDDKKDKLKLSETENIWIVNHKELQEKAIEYAKSKETSGTVLHNQESV